MTKPGRPSNSRRCAKPFSPVVQDNFVERRRVTAEVEWVGRSEALALRTAGVFRGLVTR